MKAGRGHFPAAAERPDPKVRVYLFHGANEAGSRSLATRLLKGLEAEKQTFTGAALKSDPGALAAEASAISMFGGRNLLWVEPAGDEVWPSVEAVLAATAADHPVVLIAGPLKKTSVLLKAVEAHPSAVAHVSYVPEGRDALQLVADLGRVQGLRISPALAAEFVARTGSDQAVMTQELAKFALYLGASPDGPRELDEEVLDVLGADSSETDSSQVSDVALSGDLARLTAELDRLESSGVDAIPVVRMLQRRLIMLAGLRSRLDAGQRSDQVLAAVWRRDKEVAAKALPRWTSVRLAVALDRVAKLERSLLLTPAPDRAALGEELVQIARSTRR
ncbi:MAG TPA: DNA polymerase III subunit delta [Sphingomicrobium sp.]|nr:DNA polymerase III subunit delta [Sphingomicrobium sp.]